MIKAFCGLLWHTCAWCDNSQCNCNKSKKLIKVVSDGVMYGSGYQGCSQEHIKSLKNHRLSEDVEQKVLWENANEIFETII